jgi:hypothetical protein
MNELIEKIENLKIALDRNTNIIELKKTEELIMQDEELLNDIKKYQETNDVNMKNKIIETPVFSKYKHLEAECNFIILEINKRLKEINDKGKCS